MRHTIATGIVILSAVVLNACGIGAVTTNHGHLMSKQEIQQIQPGMGKEQVRVALGTPDTTSTIGGGSYYYISSKNQTGPFMSSRVIDRTIAAVYFNEIGTVERIAHYGLKDGKVIDFITRKTPSHGRDVSLLKQLFRNIGQGAAAGI